MFSCRLSGEQTRGITVRRYQRYVIIGCDANLYSVNERLNSVCPQIFSIQLDDSSMFFTGAVQSDLGLDVVKKANIRDTKNRFEHGDINGNGKPEQGEKVNLMQDIQIESFAQKIFVLQDDIKLLKERSAVSGINSKWENPVSFVTKHFAGLAFLDLKLNYLLQTELLEKEEKSTEPDIEVAACKARKMKEKFEKKARKEEKKNKTPKPKPRSVSSDTFTHIN